MLEEIRLFADAQKNYAEKYLLINILSKRVRQLKHGAEYLISPEESEGLSLTEIALLEIGTKKITLAESGSK